MQTISAGQTYFLAERFDKVLKAVRHALAGVDLEVVGEFAAGERHGRSRILLVDSPLLLFEALALDRAAAVFFPAHILVSSVDGRTQVSMVNLPALFEARLPLGAAEPMERLLARVALAMESVLQRSDRDSR